MAVLIELLLTLPLLVAPIFSGGTAVEGSGVVIPGATVNVVADGKIIANQGISVASGQTIDAGSNRIQNVANGVVSTDAVNVSQLSSSAASTLNSANLYTDNKVTAINNINAAIVSKVNEQGAQIAQNSQDIVGIKNVLNNQQTQINNLNAGVAMAGALSAARSATVNGDGIYASGGTAYYANSSALSLGLVGVKGDFSLSANVAYSPSATQNQAMFAVGASKKLW